MTPPPVSPFEALLPSAMAEKAEEIGVKKAGLGVVELLGLGVLAGAFVAVGAIFATVVGAGANGLPFGVVKLLSGVAFSVGLILIVVGGGELFTGNNLIIMAFASRRIGLPALLRNWALVYLGNFAGSVATAALVFLGGQYTFGGGAVGLQMLAMGEAKSALGFVQALVLGMLCNAIVCMAVWMTYSARTTVDKIAAIIPPIAAFVAAGFEHSVANMYFIPVALMVKAGAPAAFFETIRKTPADFPHLTMQNFLLANLLPVTIGNIVGGAVMVGMMYWAIYRRRA
jgi:formate/nitrite transporter